MAKVLHIEDNQQLANDLKLLMEQAGHEVTHVQNCEKAIEVLKDKSFNVIVSDENLGRAYMKGTEFAQRIYEDGSSTPLIISSSDKWEKVRTDGGLVQTTPELGKPVSAYLNKLEPKFSEKMLDLIGHFTDLGKGELEIK